MTDDLASRVLAAIEGTERIARDTYADVFFLKPRRSPSAWSAEPIRGVVVTGRDHLVSRAEGGLIADAMSKEDATHIARQDPSTTLRRCAADRKLVELHVKVVELWDQGDERGLFDVAICRTCAYGASCDHCFDRDSLPLVAWPCLPLRLLAEGYGVEVARCLPSSPAT